MSNYLTPQEIAGAFEKTAVTKASLSAERMTLLGILAGMYIAFGAFASQMISHTIQNPGLAKFAGGAVFPIGLILVVIAGAELFTGNTLMVIGYSNKAISLAQMLRNWVVVYFANFVGAIFVAYLISESGLFNMTDGLLGAAAIKTAAAKSSLGFKEALIRGIFCNILVVLAVWMAASAKDIVGKVFAVWFPVMTFVMSGFEHSIANMYFIPAGIFAAANPLCVEAAQLSASQLATLNINGFLANIIPVTLGNIIGGSIVIGLIYWFVYSRQVPTKVPSKKAISA